MRVELCGILLHASCLISEFCCLMSLRVCNKDATSYIISFILFFLSYDTLSKLSLNSFSVMF